MRRSVWPTRPEDQWGIILNSKMLGMLAAGLLAGPIAATAAPVLWAGNGHYYEFISTVSTWTDARAAALGSTFNGQTGYLATVTSQAENDFVFSLLGQGTQGGWLGGTDAVAEGTWRWADGPETGVNFWNGDPSGSSPTYANWDAGGWSEPNGGTTENYATLTTRTNGGWNDLADNGTYYLTGYFVEYSSTPVSVPEPGTLALAGISLAGIAASRRRRQPL